MRRDAKALYHYRHLIRYLVATSLRTENVNTYFGFVWWLLDPILMTGIYVLLVAVFLGRGIPHFPIYILTGLLAYEFTIRAIRNAMSQTLLKERAMRQIAFPRTVIPIAATLGETIHFLVAMVVVVFASIGFGIYPTAWVIAIIPVTAIQLLFTLGLTFFFAGANMFFRDVGHLSQYLFRLWFHLSPAFYLAAVVPLRYRGLYNLNPFATFFSSYRGAVMYASTPAWGHLAGIAGASLITTVGGYAFFVSVARKFARVE